VLGHLGFSLFSGSLVADGLSIGDDAAFSSQPFLTAKTIHIGVETGPLLFHRELHVTGLTIDGPVIALLRKQDGTWNYSSLGGKRTAHAAESNTLMPNLTVGHLDIEDGTLTLGTLPAQGQPRMYSNVKISAQNFSLVGAFPYTVSAKLPAGGSLDASGTAGPIDRRDASLTPLTAQLSLKHADLVGAGLVDAGQGIAGVADLDAKIASNGQSAQADGTLHLTQVKLAKNGSPSSQPLDVDFSVEQNLQTLSGKIARANVRVGKAAVAVTGDYTTRGNIPTVQMKANGQGIPIDDLVAFLPSLGVQLPAGSRLRGGSLAMSLTVSGPTTAPVISGPVRVANTQLAGFNLGQKLASVQALTGAWTGSDTTIQELSTDLHYGPDGTRTDNLRVVVEGLGSASGGESIRPGGALNYRLVVKLGGGGGTAAQPLSLLAGALGTGVLGTAVGTTMKNGIAVTITGTTSNPTFTPDMGKMVSGAIPGKSQAPASLGKTLSGLFHHP
jgi:AsmA protein